MANEPLRWDSKDSHGIPRRWGTPGLKWNGTVPKQNTKHMNAKVSLGFATGSDHEVEETAEAVITNTYGKPEFPSPPVTQANLQLALDTFTAAIGIAAQGGTSATADKNDKREELIALLRDMADFVQTKSAGNLATLLSSGFKATNPNTAQTQLATPDITKVTNGDSGQLLVTVPPVPNSHGYEGQYAAIGPDGTPGPWIRNDAGTDSRSIEFNGLTPGVLYNLQVRAIGGSTKHSDWSNTVQHRSL